MKLGGTTELKSFRPKLLGEMAFFI